VYQPGKNFEQKQTANNNNHAESSDSLNTHVTGTNYTATSSDIYFFFSDTAKHVTLNQTLVVTKNGMC